MKIEAENVVDPITEHVATIFAAIAEGSSVRDACGTESIRNALKYAMKRDDSLRRRYQAALAAGASKRKPRFPERVFSAKQKRLARIDDVLNLVASGVPLELACRQDPNFPTVDQFWGRLKSDSALRARYEAVRHVYRHPVSPRRRATFRSLCRRFNATKFPFIERRVASGMLPVHACEEVGLTIRVARLHFGRSKALRERWSAAKAACWCARSQRSGALRYAEEIISKIEAGAPSYKVLAERPEYPSLKGLCYALDSVPELRYRYDRAIAANRAKWLRGRRAAALKTDHLWQLALDALPRHLHPDERHDIASDIVVALLAGEISSRQIKAHAHRFIAAHRKLFSTHRTRSLDEPIYSDSTLTRGETITTGWD